MITKYAILDPYECCGHYQALFCDSLEEAVYAAGNSSRKKIYRLVEVATVGELLSEPPAEEQEK